MAQLRVRLWYASLVLSRRLASSFVLLAALLAPTAAEATGRLPTASAVLPDPHDSKTVFARTSFGLVVTRDGGDSWRWICDRATGVASGETPAWVMTPKGTLVGALSNGIAVSRDGGCTFSRDPRVMKTVAVRGHTPLGRTTGELVGVSANGLLLSSDDGQTFTATPGTLDPAVAVSSIALAASEPARIYVAGTRPEGGGVLFASVDGGMTWAPRKIDLLPGESPIVAAVDPQKADRVYVRTTGEGDVHARLLVSDDAGKTWKKLLDGAGPTLAVALAGDGSRLFAGDHAGVSSSPTDTFAFTKGAPIEVDCLTLEGNTLWACSTGRRGFFLGTSRNGARSFDPKLLLDELKGPVECPTEAAKACADEWPKLRAELGIPDPGVKSKGEAPSGPALRGQEQRSGRAVSGRAAAFGIVIFAYIAYEVLRRIRKRQG